VLLDFVLPAENPIDQQVRQQGNAQGTMQLDLRWANDHDPGVDGCPATAWQADSQRFTARPRTNDHHMGMLRLGGANDRWDQSKRIPFDVYQVDPDGTALKTVDFVLSAQRLIDKSHKTGTDGAVTYTTGDDQPVAALRAGGSVSPAMGVPPHWPSGPPAAPPRMAPSAAARRLQPGLPCSRKMCCAGIGSTCSRSSEASRAAGNRCVGGKARTRLPRRARSSRCLPMTRATSRAHRRRVPPTPPAAPTQTITICTNRCSAGLDGAW
jgi:hypothetical protein